MVGWSPKVERPSHHVGEFLHAQGYAVWPVNPGQAGQRALGTEVAARLADLPPDIEMVDIFRRSEEVGPVVEEALATFPRLKVIWMQLGVENAAAAAKARAQGVSVVQNRCPAIEIPRLGVRR